MELTTKEKTGHATTVIMGVLTVLATLIAAIPAFVQLSQDRPKVFYDVRTVSLINPDASDAPSAWQVLRDNGIPDARFFLSVVNKGDGQAGVVKVGIDVPGIIREIATEPPAKSNPVWVEIPTVDLQDAVGNARAQVSLRELGIERIVTVNVGFTSTSLSDIAPDYEVFFDGRPAEKVVDVAAAAAITGWDTLRLPFVIFGAGVLITVLIATVRVVMSREELRFALLKLVVEVTRQLVP